MPTATALRTNGQDFPRTVEGTPVFTWRIAPGEPGGQATGVQVEVSSSTGSPVWDSGVVSAPGVPALAYSGPTLAGGAAYTWRVRLTDADGDASDWSAAARFETALAGGDLSPARWIRVDHEWEVGETAPVQYFRRELSLPGAVRRARSYSTALGWYRIAVNGEDVTGPGLFPGFTAFESRVQYQVRDVTDALRAGDNVISLMLADGRFRGRIGATGEPAVYGNRTAVIARVEVELDSGETIVLGTDASWESGFGAIGASDPRAGEAIDARLVGDLDRVGGSIPTRATTVEVDEDRTLVGDGPAPLVASTPLAEVGRTRAPSGALVVDFGQNFHGVARITARGPAGSEVVVHHSEVLTPDGELDLDYLFAGLPVDIHLGPNRLTLSGGEDVFQPTFSTQGFRYIGIEAADDVEIVEAVGIPVFADIDYHGRFSSSHPLVDRFHENVLWSMRGNFLDVPTDCPTRERSGWTGDAQVFAPTALLLADAAAYLRNWLADARLQQHSDGVIPDIVPVDADGWREGGFSEGLMPGVPLPPPGSAGWGDAIVLVPWAIYQATGETSVLGENYEAMKKWVERYPVLAAHGADPDDRYFVDSGYHWGEWLEPAGEGDGAIALPELVVRLHEEPRAWVATAYFEHSSRTLSTIATLLGQPEDAEHFLAYADGAREAWQRHYLPESGLLPDAQATYVRALAFDLVDADRRAEVLGRLVERVRARDTHLGTGFLSTALLLEQLSANGADDVALDLLLQTSAPSWLGQVAAGATTVWETWTGHDEQGKAMMSHNHYSLGASAGWLYERLAGVRAAEPGWRRITVDPLLNRRIDRVAASTSTPFGPVSVEWALDADQAAVTVEIPPGATGTVHLRGASADSVTVDGLPLGASGTGSLETERGVEVDVACGRRRLAWVPAESAIVV